MFLHTQVPAVLAVLKAARALGLVDDLDDIVTGIDGDTDGGGCGAGGSSGSGAAGRDSGGGDAVNAGDDPAAGSSLRVPFALLRAAVGSRREELRVDALALICTNPRTSSLPGEAQACRGREMSGV